MSVVVRTAVKTALFAGVLASGMGIAVVSATEKARPAAAYSWTGPYIGGNLGYRWGNRTATITPNDDLFQSVTCGGIGGSTCAPPTSFNVSGALGGLQVGYNWQFNRNWLLGIETDFNWPEIRGTGVSNFFLPFITPAASNIQATQDVNWFGTVRGRLGFVPADNMLVYGTAGFAYGRVAENVVLNTSAIGASNGTYGYSCFSSSNCFLGSSSRTATGWTAGAGLEYAPWNNISIKSEYLYINLGGGSVSATAVQLGGGAPLPSSFTVAFGRTDFHVVRVGINFKFGDSATH